MTVTKSTIAKRIKEHFVAVKNRQVNKSAIAKYLLESRPSHWIKLHKPQVISTERNYFCRLVRDAVKIQKFKFSTGFTDNGYQHSCNSIISGCNDHRKVETKCTDVVSVVYRCTEITNILFTFYKFYALLYIGGFNAQSILCQRKRPTLGCCRNFRCL